MESYVTHQFSKLLDLPVDNTVCINLERCLFNWSVRRSKQYDDVPTWENKRFRSRYKHKFVELKQNLIRCPENRDNLKNGTVNLKTKKVSLCVGDVNQTKRHISRCKRGPQMNQ